MHWFLSANPLAQPAPESVVFVEPSGRVAIPLMHETVVLYFVLLL
jgi:hypothetical protein